jgi:hypothetical protein
LQECIASALHSVFFNTERVERSVAVSYVTNVWPGYLVEKKKKKKKQSVRDRYNNIPSDSICQVTWNASASCRETTRAKMKGEVEDTIHIYLHRV